MVNEERLREILGDGDPILCPPDWCAIAVPMCCAEALLEWANWLRQEVLPEANQAEKGGMRSDR